MKLDEILKEKHGRTKESDQLFSPKSNLGKKTGRVMNHLKVAADSSGSRAFRIAAYGGIGAVAAAYLASGYISRAGEYAINIITNVPGLKALPLKAKVGITSLVLATGGAVYVGNVPADNHQNQSQQTIEAKLPIETYRLTENDVKIHRRDIFYGLLEKKFGYQMHDNKGRYVPLRTTEHHKSNHETFLDAFKRLNPDLYSKLKDRERKARRPGDSIFQYLRPGDTISFYTADTKPK